MFMEGLSSQCGAAACVAAGVRFGGVEALTAAEHRRLHCPFQLLQLPPLLPLVPL